MCDPQAKEFFTEHSSEVGEAVEAYGAGSQLNRSQVKLLSKAFPGQVLPWRQARLCNDRVFRWFMSHHTDLCDAVVNRICSHLPVEYHEVRSAFSHQDNHTLSLGARQRFVICDILIAMPKEDKKSGDAGRYVDLEHQNRDEHDVMQRALTTNCLMFGCNLPENSDRTDIPGCHDALYLQFQAAQRG
jgi:hypothetical protein